MGRLITIIQTNGDVTQVGRARTVRTYTLLYICYIETKSVSKIMALFVPPNFYHSFQHVVFILGPYMAEHKEAVP